jgi:hypothetical protein
LETVARDAAHGLCPAKADALFSTALMSNLL